MIADLVRAQALDVFRIGLLAALLVTMIRTRAATGVVVPLAAGILFVAVIVPLAQTAPVAAPFRMQVATGLVVNACWVMVGLLIARLVAPRR